MKKVSRKGHRVAPSLLLLAAMLLGLAACGGAQSEEQERATEEALAATETDTARAASDTADTAGTWGRADTMGAARDTAAAGGQAPTGEVTYETYRNDKFGFSVRYPSGVLQPTEGMGNGNGHVFKAPDGSASMLVYATGEATSEKLRQRFEEQTTNPDLNVTYQTQGDGWYVLSGYRGDHIFYERADIRGGALKVVRMFYDRSRKRYFDSIVREVSFSLKG